MATVRILVQAQDQASQVFAEVTDKSTKMGKAIEGALLGAGAAVGFFATQKLQQFAKAMTIDAIGVASSFAESLNKVRVVFGESAGVIEAFAKTAAETAGLSRAAALEISGTFGNMFVTMGMGTESAATMAETMVRLAADMASFNNIGVDEALEKIRAGLVGEAEPLRTVGVLLSAAAVEAKAVELGLVGANGELSEAAKVQARYALILEQTTLQQGDFARTSDGLANAKRRLNASIENLQITIGTRLLPVVERVTAWLAEKLPPAIEWLDLHFEEITTKVRQWAERIWDLIATFTPFGQQIQFMIDHARQLWDMLSGLIGFVDAVFKGEWGRAWDEIKQVFGAAWDLIWDTVVDVALAVPSRLLAMANAAGVAAVALGRQIRNGIVTGLQGALDTAIDLSAQVANAVISVINRGIRTINLMIPNRIAIPFAPDIDLPDNPIPEIPFLAEGGIVWRPTLAMLGERGPEAVVPLNRAGIGGMVFQPGSIVITTLDGAGARDALMHLLVDLQRQGRISPGVAI